MHLSIATLRFRPGFCQRTLPLLGSFGELRSREAGRLALPTETKYVAQLPRPAGVCRPVDRSRAPLHVLSMDNDARMIRLPITKHWRFASACRPVGRPRRSWEPNPRREVTAALPIPGPEPVPARAMPRIMREAQGMWTKRSETISSRLLCRCSARRISFVEWEGGGFYPHLVGGVAAVSEVAFFTAGALPRRSGMDPRVSATSLRSCSARG
jgi:hypothetical protein